MKIFVTGASGFIGSKVVKELVEIGHEVTGLARSDESAKIVTDAGATALRGSLEDLDVLKQGASQADAVLHTAFVNDFANFAKSNEIDKAAIEAMGEVLLGTNKPIVVTGGILGLPKTNGFATEADAAPELPRSSEAAAMALAEKNINASVVRLPPSVYGAGRYGLVSLIMEQAQKHGLSAYIGDGDNRWPTVHRLDAAHLFCLAIEKGLKGMRYNAVGEEGVKMRDIAEAIGEKLNIPVKSVSAEEAPKYLEWMTGIVGSDEPATAYQTKELLGWAPTHPGLIEEIKENYL